MRWFIIMAGFALGAIDLNAAEPAPVSAAVAVPEIVLEGIVVERPGVGFMTVTMNGPALVLRFYDLKKKAMPPDVERATVRIAPAGRDADRRVLILSADGQSLTHGQPLRPPHVFKLFITLVRGGVNESSETHTVDFR